MMRTTDGKLAILDFGLMTEVTDNQKYGAFGIYYDYELPYLVPVLTPLCQWGKDIPQAINYILRPQVDPSEPLLLNSQMGSDSA
ncbi:hypothetical protein THAOC_31742 [Thalassiosira oceanica]|uniref:Protein kinase domain-containing protein n=1 Tax=Thalassiosira oceanica TaxID=159749 RepID=K0R8L8_THAOC|nr:hypothetical protein THAOC_31742 [Thalassiosira oceanica]|eukprot:EJK49390.1 hypothetical protein THAOC_31742 [Thalassiosira oceanica]